MKTDYFETFKSFEGVMLQVFEQIQLHIFVEVHLGILRILRWVGRVRVIVTTMRLLLLDASFVS